MKLICPILIAAPPRCGSSNTAGIIDHYLDVSMGNKFQKHDERNSLGFWEDIDFLTLTMDLVQDRVRFSEYRIRVENYIEKRIAENKPWGIKDPRISILGLFGFLLNYFHNPTIIRCYRTPELAAKSINEKLPEFDGKGEEIIAITNRNLDNVLYGRPHIRIEYGENRRKDQEILRDIFIQANGITT